MPYPTSIRVPEDIRRILRKAAKQNRRTVTEQINYVLQEWIAREHPPSAGKPPAPRPPKAGEPDEKAE